MVSIEDVIIRLISSALIQSVSGCGRSSQRLRLWWGPSVSSLALREFDKKKTLSRALCHELEVRQSPRFQEDCCLLISI